MSKCIKCGNELLTGDIHWEMGLCNKCYNELYKDQQTHISLDKMWLELAQSFRDENEKLTTKIANLETKLAEKDKQLHYKTAECEKWQRDYENCSKLEKTISKERQYCLDNWRVSEQDKIKFCIEQLEKLVSNSVILEGMFLEGGHYLHQKKYNVVGKGDIENLIKELKKGK